MSREPIVAEAWRLDGQEHHPRGCSDVTQQQAAVVPVHRIVLWGTCDTGKPRVRILLNGLRENGVEVLECRADPWRGIEDKSQLKGVRSWARVAFGVLVAYPVLIWRYLRMPRHDWVLLGYPSMPDIFVIRLFAWLRGAKVAMDWFLSAYDTIVLDRAMIGRKSPLAWLILAVEWLGIRLADAVFMDTRANASRMEKLFGLDREHCGHVWVGVENAAFAPCDAQSPPDSKRPMRILFYGQFIPLHGTSVIVEAARLLKGTPVEWLLIGRGQEAPRVQAMLAADPLSSVRWLDWVEYADLRRYIENADACLGIFGTSDKAASVIPNKAFQILAAGKPLITRDSEAIRELVGPNKPDIALVDAGDAQSLAEAIKRWHRTPPSLDPGRDELLAAIRPAAIGRQLLELLQWHGQGSLAALERGGSSERGERELQPARSLELTKPVGARGRGAAARGRTARRAG